MKFIYSILLLSLAPLVLARNAPRVNTERIKRGEPAFLSENVSGDEVISDEGWVQRPTEDIQASSDDIPIETIPDKPIEATQTHGNKTSQENLQIGSIVVDATRAIAGVISTIAGGVVQATEGIVGTIYRPIGNFTSGPRESCKLRVRDITTKLYKDTPMPCLAMSRLIRDVETQSVDVKSTVKPTSSDLRCVFNRIRQDASELERKVDCGLLQVYTQKYSH